MRFQRRDLAGLVVAVVGPLLLFALILESYQLWDHHGTPLLAILSMHIAIVGGLIGSCWRFVRSKDAVIGLALALALTIVVILVLRGGSAEGGALDTSLKLIGVLLFLGLNAVIGWQLLVNGLNPVLQRRDDRRADGGRAGDA